MGCLVFGCLTIFPELLSMVVGTFQKQLLTSSSYGGRNGSSMEATGKESWTQTHCMAMGSLALLTCFLCVAQKVALSI